MRSHLAAGIGSAFDNLAGIRIAVVGMLGKEAPVGHNLAGVDVPVGAGLGMADIPSTAVVDTAAAGMVRYIAYSHSEEGTACFVQEVCMVVEVQKDED